MDLSGENVLSQGISGKLPEFTWDSTGRYQVEKGKIYLTFRIKSSDYTLKTLMIHSREELPVPLYGYEYVVIGMLACLLPLCLLMLMISSVLFMKWGLIWDCRAMILASFRASSSS